MRFGRIVFAYLLVFVFLVLASLTHKVVFATSSSDSLVGYWKFDETTQGSNATDSSGDSFTGTPNGTGGGPSVNTSVTYTTFPDLRSVTFNGIDQYFGMGTSSSLYKSSFTFSAWIYPTEYNNTYAKVFQQKGTSATRGGFGIEFDSGDASCNQQVYGVIWNSSDIVTRLCPSGTLSLNTWHHVVLTYSGGTAKLYVDATDGTADSTGSVTLADPVSYNFTVGRSSQTSANFFKGNIDDARYYSRVLSTTEITALASGNHTSATWDGSSSTNTETDANWDINAVPDPYTVLTIADVTNDPVASANLAMVGLTINSGGNLSLSGFNLSFNDSSSTSGLATISGTLTLQGGETLSNLNYSNNTSAGTILYNGSGTYSSGLVAGDTYYNLTFNGIGSWTLDAALDVNGNLTITDGTLSTGGNNITLAGSWSNSDTFTHGSATVTLDGTDQTVSGTTTFYNLTKSVTAARTLTFEAGATQTIANTLTLTGQSGALLSLRSSASPTQWKFDPQGTRNITYVDVQDSNNTNAAAIAYSSTNTYGSNLTNWTTSAPTPTPTPSSSNSSSSSSNSSSAPSCSQSAPTGTPNLYQIDPSQNSVTLYFTPVSGVDSYYISYGTNSSADQFGTSFAYSDTSGAVVYTIGSLQKGTTYYFQVRAGNGCASGGWSSIRSATTTGASQKSVPFIPDIKLEETINDAAKKAAEIPIVEKVVNKKIEVTKTKIQSKPSFVTYVVNTGDSLWSIARDVLGAGTKYVSIVEQNIKEYPNLVTNLAIGDKLTIKKQEPPVEKAGGGKSKKLYDVDVKILASSGEPMRGVKVTLHSTPRTEITNKNGVAHFKDVEKGKHRVYLAYGGYDGGGQAINVTGGNKDLELVMQIDLRANFSNSAVIGVISAMGIVILFLLFIVFKKRLLPAKTK